LDAINLRGIRAYGRHGVAPHEREQRQAFEIDVLAEIDLHGPAGSDDLADTVDYAALAERIVAIVATTSYALLERLAGDIVAAVFDDARVARARVTISKPGILAAATPSVTLARENPAHAAR